MHMVTRNRLIGRKRENVSQGGDIDGDPRGGIWKHRLIKHNITGDVDPTRGAIKTLIALMQRAIAKENTHLGTKLQLVSIILAETMPASTPKNPKRGIIGLNMKHAEQGRVLVENRSGHTVNEIACRKKCLIPKPERERRMR